MRQAALQQYLETESGPENRLRSLNFITCKGLLGLFFRGEAGTPLAGIP